MINIGIYRTDILGSTRHWNRKTAGRNAYIMVMVHTINNLKAYINHRRHAVNR